MLMTAKSTKMPPWGARDVDYSATVAAEVYDGR
jgi:hypothetical protein